MSRAVCHVVFKGHLAELHEHFPLLKLLTGDAIYLQRPLLTAEQKPGMERSAMTGCIANNNRTKDSSSKGGKVQWKPSRTLKILELKK